MIEINKIYNENCLDTMKKIPDGFVDLVLTSPPYDNLRNYNGYSFQFEDIALELYRIIKFGGIVVWVIGDETKNFCESLSSFRQAIFFVEKAKFNLLDTMFYAKKNVPPTYPNMRRYIPSVEYMFVFSKGKPTTFNPIKDRPNLYANVSKSGDTQRQRDGSTKKVRSYIPKEFGMRFNLWAYHVGKNKDTKDKDAFRHPARFPEQLAYDHILSWSNEGDLVYDPLIGSGTTAKIAKNLKRNYIGSEISLEYCKIVEGRLNE
jgi:site-specific DNA-methyltransferase (adenine-specific)